VVGISAQDLSSHESFASNKQVARQYSATGPLGTKRAVIVIDEQGVVRHRHDHLLGLDYQSVDELKRALDALPAPTAN
jgi:peroxiredoxin